MENEEENITYINLNFRSIWFSQTFQVIQMIIIVYYEI